MSLRNLYDTCKALETSEGDPVRFAALLKEVYDTTKKIDSVTFTKDVMYDIEEQWLSRAKVQFGAGAAAKRGAVYQKAECEFFVGAMAAMQTLFPGSDGKISSLVLPKWPVSLMSGRPLADLKEHGQ